MVEIVEVVVYLDRRELTLVDDVGRGEGTDVEALGQTDLVCSRFPQYVQLSFKVFGIEFAILALASASIVRFKHDKRLPDLGLLGSRSRSQDRVVGRNISPSQCPQS